RVRLHWRIAAALERLHSGRLDSIASEIAEHYVAVARTGAGVEPALRYLRLAGEHAARSGAYREAATAYETALETSTLTAARDPVAQGELWASLAEARAWAQEIDSGFAAAENAARIAQHASAPDIVARAALSVAVLGPAFGPLYDRAVALLEQ